MTRPAALPAAAWLLATLLALPAAGQFDFQPEGGFSLDGPGGFDPLAEEDEPSENANIFDFGRDL